MMLHPKLYRPAALSLCVLVAALALACGGGGDDGNDDATTTPDIENTPQAEATSVVDIPDGVPSLVVGAALRKDFVELAGLTFYRETECEAAPADPTTTPACRPDEEEGDSVLVFPVVGCAADLVRPEQVPDAYSAALPQGEPEVFAAFTPEGVAALDANNVTVIGEGGAAVAALFVNADGRIVALRVPCEGDATTLYSDDVVGEFIIDPPGG